MSARLTLLGSHDVALRQHLENHPKSHERAAIVLFRRFQRQVEGLAQSDRFLSVEVIPFEDDWISESSATSVAFDMRPLRRFFQRCEDEGLVFGFVHSHPPGAKGFSGVDNKNEQTILQALTNRNGVEISFVAMLLVDGAWICRIRKGAKPRDALPVRHTMVLGERAELFGYEPLTIEEDSFESREAAAFGKPFVSALRSLRVGVIGAGGTGSPVITLLARAGVGELVIIDADKLSPSNLNRVKGVTKAQIGQKKSALLSSYIQSLGLPTNVTFIDAWVDESAIAIDALASCDVLFGCTDDQIGREVLNATIYYYALPLIDVGLGGKVVEDQDGAAILRNHHARISRVLPEFGECLFCQGVIDPKWIAHQYALRQNPKMTEEEARERYLEGGGEAAPGVGPFTSVAADLAVTTLFDMLRPFRRLPPNLRSDLINLDFVGMEFRSPQYTNRTDCTYCGTRDLLLRKEQNRLNRPRLGKPLNCV